MDLKFIELNMNLPQYQIESMKKTKMYHDISKEYGVYYAIFNNCQRIRKSDTVSEMGHTRVLIQTVSEEFPDYEIFSGFDEFMLHNMLSGGNDCIGGLSYIYPELASTWIHAVDERNLEACENIQKLVEPRKQGEVKGGKSDFGAKRGLVMLAFAPYLPTESVWIKMWLLHGTGQPEPYKY